MKRIVKILISTILLSLLTACAGFNEIDPSVYKPKTPTVVVPTVFTSSVSSITETSAVCGGNVTSDGGASVTKRGVVWSTFQNPTVESCTGKTTDGSGTGSFTSSFTGLSASTTYYVRAYATNSAGTSYGEQKSFTTKKKSGIPTVTTSSVSSITETSASCGGNVTSDGGASVTARGVVWSKSQNPTITSYSGKTTDGSGIGSFTSSLTGLDHSTTYYVRSYATNSAGTSYGEQKTFTTQTPGEATDLSAGGTANCYVVSQAGKYKFKATVKGGTSESIGTPSSAEVLWESFGTDVTPEIGDIVTGASYSDGYVTFSTPSTLNNGNAVIAVKDASGTILWSWHVWVCNGFNPEATAQEYNHSAGTMMDRNLGATSATPGDVHALGLLYQWGRKDPFLSGQSISSSTRAASTGTWPSATASTSSTGTFSYVEKNPMQFIAYNDINSDWYYTGTSSTDNTRWQTSDKTKGKYDPCPPGWRVPDGGDSGIWSTAFGSSSSFSGGPWDDTNNGMDFGSDNGKGSSMQLGSASTIWYPASGCLNGYDGSLDNVGYYGYYWSCTPDGDYAYCLGFNNNGGVGPSVTSYVRAIGRSVRCVSD